VIALRKVNHGDIELRVGSKAGVAVVLQIVIEALYGKVVFAADIVLPRRVVHRFRRHGGRIGGGSSQRLAGLRGGSGGRLLNDLDGVVDIGQLNLQAAHEDIEIAHRLSQRPQFAGHFTDARGD